MAARRVRIYQEDWLPFQNLPALHRELRASGWLPDDLIYPTYRSLWAKLSSRPEPTV